ncbi:putative succinate-semialdehyde dehydrogenase [Coniella lustricola]|uniref:Putative succinate-semialdehyde dehydrogenase n=1 Tax=Coniella lustricola TaxID=2025994 RepID=A0A2T2ZV31_9PEZI|nr:putative succinate-semialdehyde dehydrogenase [Coniella lustricola]
MHLPFQLHDNDLFQPACFVNGAWTAAKSSRRFDVQDPGTGRVWASCPDSAAADVDAAVASSHAAFQTYSRLPPRRRAQLLMKWHALIVAARDDLARLLVYETGKPLAEAHGELDYATGFTWWFAGEAERIHGSLYPAAAVPGRRVLVAKQPVGVAVALCPWNFPIAMVLRKAGAALAAGCTMVVKPSPETPVTTLCLANLAVRAGFAPGVLNVLTTSLENTPAVGEALCCHPLVKKVSFTGSTRVGKLVGGLCAKGLKKLTLELGGNCPFVVFDDADLDHALGQLMALKWRHAGQACISANRVFVQAGVHDVFVEKLVQKTKELKMGHGMDKDTTLGPVTTPRGLDKAEHLYRDAVDKGATAVMGSGERKGKGQIKQKKEDDDHHDGHDGHDDDPKGQGFFMEPTILTGVHDGMDIAKEESFSPVLGVFKFETEEEAVTKANDTSMGLASYVFSQDADCLWRMFEKLEAGMIGLNTGNQSSAESPFGGIKESGMGKESGKDVAVDAYLISKTGTWTVKDHY